MKTFNLIRIILLLMLVIAVAWEESGPDFEKAIPGNENAPAFLLDSENNTIQKADSTQFSNYLQKR